MAFLKGLDNVLSNLNKAIKEIEGRSVIGMGKAVMMIRREMDTTAPMIPVDTGNLRASWFMYPLNLSAGPAIIFGFSARYAVFVHEMLGAHFQRPGAGPKFLQSPLRRKKDEILRIIGEEARIK